MAEKPASNVFYFYILYTHHYIQLIFTTNVTKN